MNRRLFLASTAGLACHWRWSSHATAAFQKLLAPVRLSLLADLHHDIMHDGLERLQQFVSAVKQFQPHAVLQLGDFAYPKPQNRAAIDLLNQSHEAVMHVIGNHDTDSGHTKQQCLDLWGMPARYYQRDLQGLSLLILDGNDRGSPTHRGGYPAFIGPEQLQWLEACLSGQPGPFMIVSHQPLAGVAAVDNAAAIQKLLTRFADKILLAVNGHSHLDSLVEKDGVTYVHINSAAYYWVGDTYQHASYAPEVHAAHPWISRTCPYRSALFAELTLDPMTSTITLKGRDSQWVGATPKDLGLQPKDGLTLEREIAPRVSDRQWRL